MHRKYQSVRVVSFVETLFQLLNGVPAGFLFCFFFYFVFCYSVPILLNWSKQMRWAQDIWRGSRPGLVDHGKIHFYFIWRRAENHWWKSMETKMFNHPGDNVVRKKKSWRECSWDNWDPRELIKVEDGSSFHLTWERSLVEILAGILSIFIRK